MLRSFSIAVCACALILCGVALGQQQQPAADYLKASPEALKWFQDAKFGLFIHWGPVSLMGTEISWSRGGERRGRGGRGKIPVEIYDNLYKKFNPTKFNANEWVALAKEAGMKYLVFTTKHHDGFCMFDSKLTEYKITNSPFRRDVVGELADACHKGGLKLGFYYSPPDWHHPDYRTKNHDKYIQYLHGQLRELCTNYGKVDIIWFDGLGGKARDWDAERLFKMIRTLQPGVLINNRCGLPGDFDTPEQRVGRYRVDRPWESCITLGTQWAWKPNDKIKSLKQCIHLLVQCVGGGGNLLLNVGPMPTGEIEPRQAQRLREIGQWLARYGESVYGTRGGPVPPQPWGVTAHKENKLYVHILNWDKAGQAVALPPLGAKLVRSSVLTGGTADVRQTAQGIEIRIPQDSRDEIDTIVVLTFDRPLGKGK